MRELRRVSSDNRLDGSPDGSAEFEAQRPRLLGLAYRLLGSVSDAEDVVQEAWFRWAATDRATIERPIAWLTTVVSRLGLDRLRATSRSRVDYVGPWLPEPLVRPISHDDPALTAEVSDSLTTAFLVLLEALTPEERLVLLLVDVFGESFRAAATASGKSEEACRQLAVRARRKVRQRSPDSPVRQATGAEQLAVASAFVGAVMTGDLEAVLTLLSPDVVLVSDGGAQRHAARRPVVGAERVARFVVNIGRRYPAETQFDPVWVNGRPGVLMSLGAAPSVPYMITAVEVENGRVTRCFSILNPDKLRSVGEMPQLV